MTGIGVLYEKSLYILLKNFLDVEVVFIEEISKAEDVEIVIIDQSRENIINQVEELKNQNKKVILCGLKADYKLIKTLESKNLIDGFFEKEDHYELENILESIDSQKVGDTSKILIKSDKNKYYHIDPNDINYIVYDRLSRKSSILTENGEIKSKRKMQELEDLFCENKNFIRADRGCIVNISNITAVDLEGCNMFLRNGDKVFQSASALKEILKNIEEKKEVIKI